MFIRKSNCSPGRQKDLPIDPPDLKQYFKLIEDGERNLPDLLANILIRRTRTTSCAVRLGFQVCSGRTPRWLPIVNFLIHNERNKKPHLAI